MKRLKIHRRAWLAGLGGATVSLPFLEIMGSAEAHAQGGYPHRYVVALQGMAQSRSNAPSSPGFAPLADLGGDVSFVSGLAIGADRNPGPGQRPPGPFHPCIINPLVTGVRSRTDRRVSEM